MPPKSMTTKHIFVTGGVASSLGKGLTASSLGALLKARGLRVTMQKLDPYLNVDPGTMNPFQHGEVFVTNDGAETDLDIGHYERFLDVDLDGSANVTTGQVYSQVIAKERRGEYLGDTVQVIPHITNEIKHRIRRMATADVDVVITEVGGTVGDIESLPFLETVRQVRHEVGRDNVFVVHISLLPYIGPSGELKTKPTQHSVAALRNIGIQPDAIVLRADREVPTSIKRKISLMCDVDEAAVVAAIDAKSIYDIPKVLHTEGLDAYVVRKLDLPFRDVNWTVWEDLLDRVHNPDHEVKVALVGKYIDLPDAYLSVTEALRAGLRQPGPRPDQVGHLRRLQDPGRRGGGPRRRGRDLRPRRLRRPRCQRQGRRDHLRPREQDPAARSVPGPAVRGHRGRAQPGGHRGRELHRVRRLHPAPGHLDHGGAAGLRRGRGRPGRHHASGHVHGQAGRGFHRPRGLRRRVRRRAPPPPLRGQQRLPRRAGEEGRPGLLRHLPDNKLVEYVEYPREVHPYLVATQAHPELRSRPTRPHPLFAGLVKAAVERQKKA